MTIPPADMLLFAAVVLEGSFTKAARRFGITKQTTSERIGKLEERLGVRLLERTTRRLRPTEAGATYYEKCAAIAAQIEEANAEVQRRQTEPVGTLRVTAPALYGRRFLGPVLTDYLGRYPKMRAELLLTNRRVELIEEGIDLAIRVGLPEDVTMAVTELDEGHVYYVASPGFLAKHATLRAEDLRSVRCIGLRASDTWEVEGLVARVEPVLVVNDLEMACEAAVAGVGVAELPALVCREAVRAGRLSVLFGPEPARRPAVYAVGPARRHFPLKVRLFVQSLQALVAPMLPLDAAGQPPRSAGRAAGTSAGRKRGSR
jgi:DNA-binding transcriptional LysR family regulator